MLVALLSAQTEATKATTMSEMEECVCQVASYSDAQMSRAATDLRKQLGAEIEAATMSVAQTAATRTQQTEERI